MMASSVNFCLAPQTFWTWRYSEPSKQRNILHQAKHFGLGDIQSHPSRGTFCIKMEALKKRQLKQNTALFAQSEDDVAKEVTGSMESIINRLESINNGLESINNEVDEVDDQLDINNEVDEVDNQLERMMDEEEDCALLRKVAIGIENELKLDYLNQCPPELQACKKMLYIIELQACKKMLYIIESLEVDEARELLEESVGAAAAADVDRQWYIASTGFGESDIRIAKDAFFDAMYIMKHISNIEQLGKRYTSLKEHRKISKYLIGRAEVWIDVAIVKDLIDRAEVSDDDWKDVAKAYVDKLYQRKVNNSLNMNKLLD